MKPAQQSGASFAPGSAVSTQPEMRVPERRVERRPRPAEALDRLQLVVPVLAEDRADDRVDVLGRLAGEEPPVDGQLDRPRDHVPALRRGDHRRREREGEQRLDRLGGERVERAQPLQHLPGRRPLTEHDVEEARDLRPDRRLGHVRGELLDQRRRLHERVVGDPRHRGVAAAAVHDDLEG